MGDVLAAVDGRIAALEAERDEILLRGKVVLALLAELRQIRATAGPDGPGAGRPRGRTPPGQERKQRKPVQPSEPADAQADAVKVLAVLRERGPLDWLDLLKAVGMKTPRLAAALKVGGWFERGDDRKRRPTTLGFQVGKDD